MQKPVFFDPSGRRRLASFIGAMTLLVIALALVGTLAVSILSVTIPDDGDLGAIYPHRQAWRLDVRPARTVHRQLRVRSGRSRRVETVTGFYVPWDDSSRESLEQHASSLDYVVTALVSVTGPGHTMDYQPDPRLDLILKNAERRPQELVMVQNAAGDTWEGDNTSALLASPAARGDLLARLAGVLKARAAAGVTFDFENLPPAALANYLAFIAQARSALAPQGYLVTVTVPAADDAWDLRAFARAADRVFLMVYDQHWATGAPGPVAAQRWFNNRLAAALKKIPADRLIVCIGNYAYDWHGSHADDLTVQEAWLIAHDSAAPIRFDKASGNASFAYEEDGEQHQVWMLDAVSAWNQLLTVTASNVSGVALWRLGSEDPAVWPAFRDFQSSRTPDLTRLSPIGNVDVEGNGEILRVAATPKFGSRTVTFDNGHVAQDETYGDLPTPYVIQRAGHRHGAVALTFDDGPDRDWTPRILRILKAKQVPATFFVTGEKAIAHPDLLRRMVRDGDQLGNHTYTHPDLSHIPPQWARLELNSTQRIVQAYTGHSMRLFRAPFFGDAEPTTDNEIGPALQAQKMGYTNVGLHVDSEDWQRPGVATIVRNVLDGVHGDSADRSGQIVLLHDAGGDRRQTVAALPIIIDRLKAEGYSFVTVGDLVGLTPDQVMPRLSGHDLWQVRLDVATLMSAAWSMAAVRWLFILAIVMGIVRALTLSALAIYAEYTGHMEPPADDGTLPGDATFVSVILPAYNEGRVIAASVRRVLQSTGVRLEVIVVDDGSKDDTSAVVAAAFAADPRVKLLTQANSGKAGAVNNGIAAARGDIIIALDADTQFEPETIARLVRWFARPEIGAVAGNAKVGNRFNWVTRWQAVEYVTAQSLERSALAMLGGIMVVPGAVGAWRRVALQQVGNYPVDTLAEDQDLTISVQRAGWKVAYDQEAVAWTEAPESFAALTKQRFRWSFGTLQCLWKHRAVVKRGRPAGLAWIGIPQAWLFQIGFSLISPLIDLALVVNIIATIVRVHQHGWTASSGDLTRMLLYWVAFLVVDGLCGAIAYRLEPREKRYPLFWLLSQRFVYRQIMYWVVIRALAAAVRGMAVGWGKIERSGRVDAAPAQPAANLSKL